ETRRPLAFLRTLFAHLERETRRLPAALEEAVAGGAEVLSHLESMLEGTQALLNVLHAGRPAAAGGCPLPAGRREPGGPGRHDRPLPMPRLRVGLLPTVVVDPQVVRVLIWAAIVAVLKSARRRGARVKLVRISARASALGLRVRIGRLDPLRRGAGIEELLL